VTLTQEDSIESSIQKPPIYNKISQINQQRMPAQSEAVAELKKLVGTPKVIMVLGK